MSNATSNEPLLRNDPEVLSTLKLVDGSIERYRSAFEEISSDVKEKAFRTEWATDEFYPEMPLAHEIDGKTSGRLLKNKPKLTKYHFSFDFDHDDRILARRYHVGNTVYVRFLLYENTGVWWCNYREPKRDLLRVTRVESVSRSRTLYVARNLNPPDNDWWADEFLEKDGVITRKRHFSSRDVRTGARVPELVYLPSYDAAGALVEISSPEGYCYWKRPKRSLSKLLSLMQERVIERVPACVAKVADGRKLYAVALSMIEGDVNGMMPPSVSIGLESNRQAVLEAAEEGVPDLSMIWNPSLFEAVPTPVEYPIQCLEEDDLLELGTELATYVADEKNVPKVTKSLITIAKKLNRFDWRSIVPVTDDFIVYVVDFETPIWETYIKQIASKKLLKTFKQKGLLEDAE